MVMKQVTDYSTGLSQDNESGELQYQYCWEQMIKVLLWFPTKSCLSFLRPVDMTKKFHARGKFGRSKICSIRFIYCNEEWE